MKETLCNFLLLYVITLLKILQKVTCVFMSYLLIYSMLMCLSTIAYYTLKGFEAVAWSRDSFFSEDYKDSSSGIFPIYKGKDTE